MSSLIPCDSSNLSVDSGFDTYFTHLLNTRTCIDVTFVLETPDGQVEFYAHQLILAIQSSYFADKFYGDPENRKTLVIHLKYVNPKAFKDMIRYCYGIEPGLEKIEDICALLKVASEFNVMGLLSLCQTVLGQVEIKPENVFKMLEASKLIDNENLRHICKALIEDNTKEVMSFYELQDINPAMIRTILNSPKLSLCSEYELIKWLFEWAKVKSKEDLGNENVRQYMENFLLDINILDLTFEQFATLCKQYPDFFNSDEIASVYLNIAFPGIREMPDWYNKGLNMRVYTGSRKSPIEGIDYGSIDPCRWIYRVKYFRENVVKIFLIIIIKVINLCRWINESGYFREWKVSLPILFSIIIMIKVWGIYRILFSLSLLVLAYLHFR